jgi:uracil-DNA glycosylase family 4
MKSAVIVRATGLVNSSRRDITYFSGSTANKRSRVERQPLSAAWVRIRLAPFLARMPEADTPPLKTIAGSNWLRHPSPMDDDLRNELTLLRELGYTHLDIPAGSGTANAEAAAPGPGEEPAGPTTSQIDDSPDLAALGSVASGCLRCRLAQTRTQVVFGTGSPTADLMFVGEAPGRDEDLQGEPFVGRAGQLLTDIIKAMKLSRAEVYIANVIKCRPPENRNPEADELEACHPYITRQIEMIQPKVIVTLGKFALQSLTGKTYSISSVRGQWLMHGAVKVMPTFHPAYLLRTPSAKKDVWNDMKKVMAELGIEA